MLSSAGSYYLHFIFSIQLCFVSFATIRIHNFLPTYNYISRTHIGVLFLSCTKNPHSRQSNESDRLLLWACTWQTRGCFSMWVIHNVVLLNFFCVSKLKWLLIYIVYELHSIKHSWNNTSISSFLYMVTADWLKLASNLLFSLIKSV